jgi:drug/metabolite transporter (DMT)-like permease
MPYLGEIAALTTAVCWSITSILFTFVVRRIGSFTLNLARLSVAAATLTILTLSIYGTGWLVHARPADLINLVLSGWIGLTLGDWAYFQSMRMLGARMATLMMALAPPFTVLLGIPFLKELPGSMELLGMALTVAGVAWVVLERTGEQMPAGHRIRGLFLGVLGSVGQALGLILSKAGMAGGITPFPATAVRLVSGCGGVWLFVLLSRRPSGLAQVRQDRRLPLAILGASMLGPVLGIWLSLVSVRHTQAGIAATLMSTVPVLVLPLVILLHHERVSLRAAAGAVLAVVGVAILFMRY